MTWQYVMAMQRPWLGKTVACNASNGKTNVSSSVFVHVNMGTKEMVEISFGLDDGESDCVIVGAENEGFVGWWWTEEISSERKEVLKGERE
ncbi:hypothetical protein CR513_05342, partial [Mucuna pruriens]